MKELTPEETKSLSIDKAFQIIQDYANLFSNNSINVIEFEDRLPWSPSTILLAATKLLQYVRKSKLTNDDEKFVESLATLLMFLPGFIPNPEKYAELIKTKELLDIRVSNLLNQKDIPDETN